MQIDIKSFGQSTIDEAREMVIAEKMNFIYCSITGVKIGILDPAELDACLRQELSRKPMADANQLVDNFAVRHVALSSGVAPSLRYHKDHDTMLRVLRSDAQGPNKLFAYLVGRFFFDSMVQERLTDGFDNRRAKLAFLVELQEMLETLPKNWSQSLTADDEENKVGSESIAMLARLTQVGFTKEEEGKAAQWCLECLLRLDTIHNLRAKFYDASLKSELIAIRDSHLFSFTTFKGTLEKFEESGIIRLSKQKPTMETNSMVLSSALAALGWQTGRISKLREKFEAAEERGRITPNSSGGQILASVSTILNDSELQGALTKADMRKLETVMKQLNADLHSVSWSDKRLDSLGRVYSRASDSRGTVKVIRGMASLKHLVEAAKDSGRKLDPKLKSKFDAAVKAGEVSKAGKASSGKGIKGPSLNGQMFASLIKNAIKLPGTE